MAVYKYAESFARQLEQKYARELVSHELTQSNQHIQFINAQTIKLPTITMSGYKDHDRQGTGFNSGTLGNDWIPMKLEHDRDIEFTIDPLDVDETNLALSIANITNQFEEQQAIPEKDSYRFSKLYEEAKKYKENGAHIDEEELTTANVLAYSIICERRIAMAEQFKSGVFPVHNNKFEVETGDNEWSEIANLEEFQVTINGVVETWQAMENGGWESALKTGASWSINLKGKRTVGDKGNDFIADKTFQIGQNANANFRWTMPTGTQIT